MSTLPTRRGSRLGSQVIRFRFDGQSVAAIEGDTAASALLANGVRLLGRSVKYRRPRGVLAAGPEEPNALLNVGLAPTTIPNVSAPQLVLKTGMLLQSQNRWPSLRFDLGAVLRMGSPLLGAGFYYKTFMWPSWRTYEGLIRRLAGLGAAPGACSIQVPRVENVACDVLVAGAGAAGLAAARAALRCGARVVLCEREPVCGGELEFEGATIEGLAAPAWIRAVLEELRAGDVRVFNDTTVIGGSHDCTVAHCEPGGLAFDATAYRIHSQSIVMATGATERPIAFVDNDRPGVMLVGAAERFVARYGVRVGERLVLFGNHDRLYAAARRFMAAGMGIVAIIDTRARPSSVSIEDLERAGVDCFFEHAVLSAAGRAVTAVRIAPLRAPDQVRAIRCDAILVSGGWAPSAYASCGAANGKLEIGAALADGHAAGTMAAAPTIDVAASATIAPVGHGDGEPVVIPFWRSPAIRSAEKRQFVDLQNDVTVADIRQAMTEGFSDIEHVKRYTTLGIGTEQGRTSGELGAAILAELSGRSLTTVGLSRSRPPLAPATLALLCGHRRAEALRPERRTPLHQWHADNGGELESMGLWMRPRFYRINGRDAMTAGVAEAARVRSDGGMVDASTLGKIEVAGADAAAFLDRLYLTKASTIKVGRSKYMVLLREDGMVLDDGIVLRIAEDRFLATVSSGHVGQVLSHFEFWRDVEFAGRGVAMTEVTESWAVIAIAGPSSRGVLAGSLGDSWRDTVERLSHMEFAGGLWRGLELRVLRASFSGELAYEIHCRPAIAMDVWQALLDAGVMPYGLEALDILRVEKGYLVSSELNGQTTPQDLGMDTMLGLNNDCIGRSMLVRPAFSESSRPRLVGLICMEQTSSFLAGAQLTLPVEARRASGHVTSAAFSPELGRCVGLGLVARSVPMGAELIARDPLRDNLTSVRVTAIAHVDPTGQRMKS